MSIMLRPLYCTTWHLNNDHSDEDDFDDVEDGNDNDNDDKDKDKKDNGDGDALIRTMILLLIQMFSSFVFSF